jgi:predicted Zn-dependent protease
MISITSAHKRRLISTLLVSALGLASLQSTAFDFKGALKDAVEKEIGQKSDSPAAPTEATSSSESAKANSTTASSEAAFNWKNPSTTEEISLGREIAGNLLGAAPLVKDAALQKYVNSVGRWVASQSERPELPWRFGVIESEDLNAFAAPGGYIMLTKGLYRKLQNEAQLAGVLGHEIAHVVKKHQLKVLQKQQLLSMGAGLLSDKYAKDNALISKAIGSGAEISARSLDKSAEYEADRLGLSYATRAGYEPYGLAEVLQTLGQSSSSDANVALLFKTHPHPDERLTALSESVGSQLDKITGKTLENRFYVLK